MGKAMSIMPSYIDKSGQIHPREVVVFGAFEIDLSQFNFNDRSSRIGWIRVSSYIFIALVFLAVALRVFARIRYVRRLFTDDLLIIAAAIFTIALSAACIAATSHGLGTHVWMLNMSNVIEIVKQCIMDLYICQVLYAFAIASTKLAIVSSYLRLIQKKEFRWSMYAISAIIIGLWITGVVVTIFQCRPVSGAWDILVPGRKCINYIDYLYASSVINVITDILLCVLPWPHLWRLNMPLKQRIVLCVLLAGGASACIVGITRIALLNTLYNTDTTYQAVPCLILSVAECSLGIISVSIPALRPLAQRLFPSMKSSAQSSQRRSWNIRLSAVPSSRKKPVWSALEKQTVSTSQRNLTQSST